MSQEPKCSHCQSEMKVKPLKEGERTPPKHVEGKGTYIPHKCVNPNCGAVRDIFIPYKSD